MIATGGWDKKLCLWDANTGELIHVMKGHTGVVYSIAFSPDGQLIATGPSRWIHEDRNIRLWNVEKGELIAELAGHAHNVYCLAFSPDGKLLASGSYDQTTRLWDVSTPSTPRQVGDVLRGFAPVYSLAFSRDGHRLFSGTRGGVNIWDVSTKQLITTLRGHQALVMAVAFSPGGNRIISGCRDGEIRIWETELDSAQKMWQAAARRER